MVSGVGRSEPPSSLSGYSLFRKRGIRSPHLEERKTEVHWRKVQGQASEGPPARAWAAWAPAEPLLLLGSISQRSPAA